MLSRVFSGTLLGIQALKVTVEVDATQGLPGEIIVGLPDAVIRESKNRIRHALRNAGFSYPIKSYTINLAPADLKKEGSFFDLPIAIGILHTTKQITAREDTLYVGELNLNGDLLSIRGSISLCEMAKKEGFKRIVLPYECAGHAQLIEGIDIIPIKHLRDLYDVESGHKEPEPFPKIIQAERHSPLDFSDVKGQRAAKRLLEIAAAGHHNVLLSGSPGSGKTMLLKRFVGILPELSVEEAIECYKIRSLISSQIPSSLERERPFRNPHHSISYAGLVGGGSNPRPGEISLAHQGVLFLDELPEFYRNAIEVLRQPLEDHKITITRAHFLAEFPAKFILLAAMNPCKCGYYKDPITPCSCVPTQVASYWKKLSGPLLDRIDLMLSVTRLTHSDLEAPRSVGESSKQIKERVIAARDRQFQRQGKFQLNAHLSPQEIENYCPIPKESQAHFAKAMETGFLSGRSYHKVLKIARTIADLEASDTLKHAHVLEAMQYRKNIGTPL